MLKQEIRKKILQNSMSLEIFGLNDLVWNRENSIKLIQSIKNDPIGILGGDVYKSNSSFFEPLYENWYCEPKNSESKEEYYVRSKAESLNYIENYPEEGENIVFSITFTEQLI